MQMEVLRKTENPPFEPTVSVESELGFGSLWEDKGAGNLQGDFPWVNYIITSTGINHITLPGRQATLDALSEQGAQAGVKTIKTSQRAEVRKAKISHMQPEPLRIQIVDEFIETVRRSEVHRPIFNGILASLTNPMKDGKPVVGAEKYTESDAHNILRILMYKHIKPYFVSAEHFFNKPSMTHRVAWLRSLLYSRFGKQMLTASIKQWKRTRAQEIKKERELRWARIRSNRPISPYEWVDDGKRYYQDVLDGLTFIPADAEPRPTDTAIWNLVDHEWYLPKPKQP